MEDGGKEQSSQVLKGRFGIADNPVTSSNTHDINSELAPVIPCRVIRLIQVSHMITSKSSTSKPTYAIFSDSTQQNITMYTKLSSKNSKETIQKKKPMVHRRNNLRERYSVQPTQRRKHVYPAPDSKEVRRVDRLGNGNIDHLIAQLRCDSSNIASLVH